MEEREWEPESAHNANWIRECWSRLGGCFLAPACLSCLSCSLGRQIISLEGSSAERAHYTIDEMTLQSASTTTMALHSSLSLSLSLLRGLNWSAEESERRGRQSSGQTVRGLVTSAAADKQRRQHIDTFAAFVDHQQQHVCPLFLFPYSFEEELLAQAERQNSSRGALV